MNHNYSDRDSFDRLMLLISAIANNPGIAPGGGSIRAIAQLTLTMKAIGVSKGFKCKAWDKAWDEDTIKADLQKLREYNILPPLSEDVIRNGYRLGRSFNDKKIPQPSTPQKNKLSPDEIVRLRDEGFTLGEIADKAGVSKVRVGQIEKKRRRELEAS